MNNLPHVEEISSFLKVFNDSNLNFLFFFVFFFLWFVSMNFLYSFVSPTDYCMTFQLIQKVLNSRVVIILAIFPQGPPQWSDCILLSHDKALFPKVNNDFQQYFWVKSIMGGLGLLARISGDWNCCGWNLLSKLPHVQIISCFMPFNHMPFDMLLKHYSWTLRTYWMTLCKLSLPFTYFEMIFKFITPF